MKKNTVLRIISFVLFAVFAEPLWISLSAETREFVNTTDVRVEILDGYVNSIYNDYTPCFWKDVLYFSSDRPGGVGLSGDSDIWFSKRKWADANSPGAKPESAKTTPKNGNRIFFDLAGNLGTHVNSTAFEAMPSVRAKANGNLEIYFTSLDSENRLGPRETNIYYSTQIDGVWTKPELIMGLATNFHERMPSISTDGNRLYFSSDRPGGLGGDDIWVSEYDLKTETWKTPQNLGPAINSAGSEISPSLHKDGITLYFSSNRQGGVGGYDIYFTQILELKTPGHWMRSRNLGIPLNSQQDDENPTVMPSGKIMFFSSDRVDGVGLMDIYQSDVPEFAKPNVVVTVSGLVKEANSPKGIEAAISILGKKGFRNISSFIPKGSYEINLLNDQIYKVWVSAPGYETLMKVINLKDIHRTKTIPLDFLMHRKKEIGKTPKPTPQKVKNENLTLKDLTKNGKMVQVYYYDKYQVSLSGSKFTKNMQNLVSLLEKKLSENKAYTVIVNGHADAKGGDRINIPLSQKRAINMKSKLIKYGLDKNRIQTKWFSSNKPAVKGIDDIALRKNRRVEVYIYEDKK